MIMYVFVQVLVADKLIDTAHLEEETWGDMSSRMLV